MITIDQLLESVDLDFEPRWVTKDDEGDIIIWAEKPTFMEGEYIDYWSACGKHVVLEKLKLAEFEGKDCIKCIYEVPRKVDYTKWLGHLCLFKDEKTHRYDILASFLPHNGGFLFKSIRNEMWEHCEPVRPDDDVIYKDAVNELKGAKNE